MASDYIPETWVVRSRYANGIADRKVATFDEAAREFDAWLSRRDARRVAEINDVVHALTDEIRRLRNLLDEEAGSQASPIADHKFRPSGAIASEDECSHRADGTGLTYCGEPRSRHVPSGGDS